jgi:hypothetical protein
MKMIIEGQVIATTNEDSHGERYDKAYLEEMLAALPARTPINRHHDVSKPSIGYFKNFRLAELPSGEWAIVADVYAETTDAFEGSGGFSWSSTEPFRQNSDTPGIGIYIPWPFYNDHELVDSLLAQEQEVAVGKWVKKSLDPVALALVSPFIIMLLEPFWHKVVNEYIWPRLEAQLPKIRELWARRVASDLLFQFKDAESEKYIQVYVATERGEPGASFSEDKLQQGLQDVYSRARALIEKEGVHPARMNLLWNPESQSYRIVSIQYESGEVVSFHK